MSTRLISLITGLFIFFGTLQIHANTLKLGYVDVQEVLEKYAVAQNVKKSLEADLEKKKAILQKLGEQIMSMKKELESKNMVLTKTAKTQKEKEIAKKEAEYNQILESSYAEMSEKEKAALKDLEIEIIELMNKMGKEEGYSFILNKTIGGILYADSTFDLTAKVIEKLNAQNTEKK